MGVDATRPARSRAAVVRVVAGATGLGLAGVSVNGSELVEGGATTVAGAEGVEVEVTVAPAAAVAAKADVDVLGTASAAGNLQSASPVFTVSVLKK